MNINALMQQAKKMQKDMFKAQEEIANKEYIGKSQCVEVTISGDYEIKKIEFVDKEIIGDEEMITDMVSIAFNDAISKVKNETQSKLGKYAGMIPGF